MAKHLALGILLAFLWVATPFRLIGLGGEALMMRPGLTHFTNDDSRYWQTLELEARIETLGWNVTYTPHLALDGVEVYGVTDPNTHGIYIDGTLHWSARAAVLAHEMAHTTQPPWLSGREADCYAEAVSAILVGDSLREHARYMASARWSCLGVLIGEFPAIYHAAAFLKD